MNLPVDGIGRLVLGGLTWGDHIAFAGGPAATYPEVTIAPEHEPFVRCILAENLRSCREYGACACSDDYRLYIAREIVRRWLLADQEDVERAGFVWKVAP